MSDETQDEKTTTKTIAVAMLNQKEDQLIRHIVYIRRYALKDFFQEAIDHFIKMREDYKPDPKKECDRGLYHSYGKKEHSIKLAIALGPEYRLKLDEIAEEDDREIRTVLRTATAEYLNHLKDEGLLDKYKKDMERTPFEE